MPEAAQWLPIHRIPLDMEIALTAFLIGFVVRRRGWLWAFAACLIGLALWVIVELRPS